MVTKLYFILEEKFPPRLKRLIPQRWRIWAGYQIKVVRQLGGKGGQSQFAYPLILPKGETERSLRDFLSQFCVKGGEPREERDHYLNEALRRFLYTLQIVPNQPGKLLEIGAHPYFMSWLLRRFRPCELAFTNFFGDQHEKRAIHTLIDRNGSETAIEFDNVNVEVDVLPHETDSFDVVLLCEVLEHFTRDPHKALLEIKRVLRTGGILVLTTPNVARLENVARLLSGDNVYDAYSAYGPYGRHNREYTTSEIRLLLEHLGFTVEQMFTSDVHPYFSRVSLSDAQLERLRQRRDNDLGQYIFVQATNAGGPERKKPRWLYHSYPSEELA